MLNKTLEKYILSTDNIDDLELYVTHFLLASSGYSTLVDIPPTKVRIQLVNKSISSVNLADRYAYNYDHVNYFKLIDVNKEEFVSMTLGSSEDMGIWLFETYEEAKEHYNSRIDNAIKHKDIAIKKAEKKVTKLNNDKQKLMKKKV